MIKQEQTEDLVWSRVRSKIRHGLPNSAFSLTMLSYLRNRVDDVPGTLAKMVSEGLVSIKWLKENCKYIPEKWLTYVVLHSMSTDE